MLGRRTVFAATCRIGSHLSRCKPASSRTFQASLHYEAIFREDEQKSSPAISNSRCADRKVLLTGGTSGIGFAVAQRLLQEGVAEIQIVTRNKQRGKETVARLQRSLTTSEIPVKIIEMDLTKGPQMGPLGRALEDMGCDTVIACAGVAQYQSLFRLAESDMNEVLATNLHSTLHLGKMFLKHYAQACFNIKRDAGRRKGVSDQTATTTPPPRSYVFIAVSSLLANKGGQGASIYAASKAGVNAFVRAMCLEGSQLQNRSPDMTQQQPAFRANVVLPGYVDTPMLDDLSDFLKVKLNKEIPLGRFAKPGEVADAVSFLLGNEYANNTVLNLDGGLSAK